MAATKFQALKKAATSYCKGKGKLASVKKAKTAYKKDAIAKGKTATQAEAIANRAMKCPAKPKASKVSGVGKTKRKTTAKRKVTRKSK